MSERNVLATYGAIAAFGALQACAAKPEGPPCDAATLAGIVAQCSARVELECASQGVPEAECAALKECDAMIDQRTEACR